MYTKLTQLKDVLYLNIEVLPLFLKHFNRKIHSRSYLIPLVVKVKQLSGITFSASYLNWSFGTYDQKSSLLFEPLHKFKCPVIHHVTLPYRLFDCRIFPVEHKRNTGRFIGFPIPPVTCKHQNVVVKPLRHGTLDGNGIGNAGCY